jgi:RNA polymerase sigma-70 factor (ECF subfamily)
MSSFEKKNIPEAAAGHFASANAAINDKETFIRSAFQKDATVGCKLLFKLYFAVLCSHAVRFVYSKQVAEDVVSEVFCRFWERKAYQTIHCSYRAYLFTAVRNAAINHLKKEFGRTTGDLGSLECDLLPGEDSRLNLQADELNQLIEKTIQSLPRKCQTIFLMSRLEGKKNAEIAGEMNLTVKAIEAHITRALERLRKALEEEWL